MLKVSNSRYIQKYAQREMLSISEGEGRRYALYPSMSREDCKQVAEYYTLLTNCSIEVQRGQLVLVGREQ